MNKNVYRQMSAVSNWKTFSSLFKATTFTLLMFMFTIGSNNSFGQTYLFSAPQGYGAGATGGGNATPTVVTTQSALSSALTASGNGVVIVSGTISCTYMSLLVTNKTLLGLPGARLRNLDQTAAGSGILNLKDGSNNFIIRNLIFEGPGAYDVDGRDNLTNAGCTKFWVDHCEFQDGTDGNFDNKNTADNITVSWCKFTYLKAPKAGGPGGANDHRFSNLVGSSDTDMPADKQYSITWQYCWWAQGCVERMTRARNAQLHMLNCYWSSTVANVALGLGGTTDCYVENSTFANTGDKYRYYNNGTVRLSTVGSTAPPANVGTAPAPSYTRESISASAAVTAITSSCGAGATLNVTSSGSVSAGSSCGGTTQPTCATPTITASATSFCSGGSATLTASSGSSYQWIKDGANISGATSQTYSVTSAGSYTVKVTCSNGASATSTATTITVNALPTVTVTAGAATTFCTGGSVTLSSTTGSSYVWRRDGSAISGATSQTYSATTAGAYTVTVTNANNCSATSTATSVTVNALPTATITAGGPTAICSGSTVTLSSSTGSSYVWKKDGTTIASATAQTYSAGAAGSYTVTVTNSNKCSATSTATTVTLKTATDCNPLSDNDGLLSNSNLSLYPNPSNHNFKLTTASAALVMIYNAEGQLIETFNTEGEKTFGNGYKAGMYLVKVNINNQATTLKVTKE